MDHPSELVDLLRATPGLRLAVAFGSAARGELRPGDLDLGLLFEEGFETDLAFEGRVQRAAGRELDLVLLASAPPLLRFEIARDGRVVHAVDGDVWVDFKTRAMIDWWDFQPTLAVYHRVAAERDRLEAAAEEGRRGTD